MHHSPIQRVVRFTFFSIGFAMFVLLAFRSSQTATDPIAVKGRPSLFSFVGASPLGLLTHGSQYESVIHAESPKAVSAHPSADSNGVVLVDSPAGATHATASAAISGSLPTQANARAFEAQQQAAVKQAAQNVAQQNRPATSRQ